MKQVHDVKAGGRNPAREELPQTNFRRRLRNASFALLVAGAMASGPFMGRARASTPEQEQEARVLSAEWIKVTKTEDLNKMTEFLKGRQLAFTKEMFETCKQELLRGELQQADKSHRIIVWHFLRLMKVYGVHANKWPDSLKAWSNESSRIPGTIQALKGIQKIKQEKKVGKSEWQVSFKTVVKKDNWGKSLKADYAREAASKKIEPFRISVSGEKWSFKMERDEWEEISVEFKMMRKSISLSEIGKELDGRLWWKQQKDRVRAVIIRELIEKHPEVKITA